jgi:hypothetical protein
LPQSSARFFQELGHDLIAENSMSNQ